MNKEQDKSDTFKLSKKDRNILIKIDKSNKWKDVKGIDDIDNELKDLDIYDDFIGLGCSKYLNEAGQNGNLNIDEMFRNCREAEKVRVRVKKKQRKEKASKARKGGKGNIGSLIKPTKETPKDIDSKQIKKNDFVEKAKNIGSKLVNDLVNNPKNWKEIIYKAGYKLSLETLFGVVIAVMEYSINNPTGAVVIGSSVFGLMASIYAVISQSETGKAIIGNVKNWFKGKFKELYDYLVGNNIKVIKKKPKKKPFDRGGGKKDDDDDDDDDSGGDDFVLDFDELNEFEEEPKEEPKEETKEEPQQQQSAPQSETTQLLNYLITSQSIAQNQALVNTNLETLFKQNANNPLTETPKTETPKTETPKTEEFTTENVINETPATNTEPINPTETPSDSSSYSTYLGGAVASLLGGYGLFKSNILNPIPLQQPVPVQRNPFTDLRIPNPNNNAESLLAPRGRIEPRYNTQQSLQSETIETQTEPIQTQPIETQTDLTTEDMREAQQQLKDFESKLKAERQKERELKDRMDKQIRDMDIRGSAWGLVNPASMGKSATSTMDGLRSIIQGIGVMEQAQESLMMKEREEQTSLMEDIESQAVRNYENSQLLDKQNKFLEKQNEDLKTELGLIRAREGEEEERKMTQKEVDAVKKQELREREFERVQRELQIERVEREQEEDRLFREQEEVLANPDVSSAIEAITGRPVGRPPETYDVNRNLVYTTQGIPYQSGGGANPVLFSMFIDRQGNPTNNFPQQMREELTNAIKLIKQTNNTSKLKSNEIKTIADIIRKYN
jgi:hypothetical protein